MDSTTRMDIDGGEDPAQMEHDELNEQFEKLELSSVALHDKLEDFVLLLRNPRVDEHAIKIKEQCIYRLAHAFAEMKQLAKVIGLLKDNGDFFSMLPKARTAKIVRNILNIVAAVPDSLAVQIDLCQDIIEWCKLEKRTFLRQRIESKLAALYLEQRQPSKALEVVDRLLPELRKLGDKQMLTEVHLTEAGTYHALQNIPKAKASLTASRTAANSIYVVPLLQAEIDLMSGTLLCEEGDYSTAYSYFLEAFDAYDQSGSVKSAVTCLKYMILCKVLKEAAAEVPALLSSKICVKHAGEDLEAMATIAKAAKEFSLEEFRNAVRQYESLLSHDNLISHHLDLLYDKMLESNLLKIIHPYSSVEIGHIAKLIKLSEPQVVQKLSQMILDHKFQGILDQGRGHLIIYDQSTEDVAFARGVEIIANMGEVVEALASRTKALNKATM